MENNVEFMEFIDQTVRKENQEIDEAIATALNIINPAIRQFVDPKYTVLDQYHEDGDRSISFFLDLPVIGGTNVIIRVPKSLKWPMVTMLKFIQSNEMYSIRFRPTLEQSIADKYRQLTRTNTHNKIKHPASMVKF